MANPSDGVTVCRVGGIPNGTAPIHLSFDFFKRKLHFLHNAHSTIYHRSRSDGIYHLKELPPPKYSSPLVIMENRKRPRGAEKARLKKRRELEEAVKCAELTCLPQDRSQMQPVSRQPA